jgi:NADH-quinone oxidoreductase subunit M
LTGFGLTLRAVESRIGRISLDEFHGLYERTPSLAVLFLITGLASIGFPGTAGFVGAELLVDGAVTVSPLIGMGVVMTAALNGLAVLHAYFHIFTGTRPIGTIDLRSRQPERVAVLVLVTLILGGGIFPQPGVASRYELAEQIARTRRDYSAQRRTAVFGSSAAASVHAAAAQ